MENITTDQAKAYKLCMDAKTQEEKNAALAAFKLAFPGRSSYKTIWSDGTVSE
jgi:hypothetical protein